MKTKTHMFMALIWGSMMAPSILLASGCAGLGLGCTEAGCDDQASISIRGIEVAPNGEAWGPVCMQAEIPIEL